MKKLLKSIAMLLVFAMLFAFAACAAPSTPSGSTPQGTTPSTPSQGDPSGSEGTDCSAIAGEYLLDGANLGMPMKWYIKVTADGNFVISTARDYATVKGEGVVGGKDGTYMFMYSDSTSEAPKTATFTMEGKNMVFSTNIPIGAASLSPNLDEGVYPTAKLIAHEDIQGTYLGEYEKVSAMAGTVLYSYALVLGNGLEYSFSSAFSMMGEVYTRTETGTFAVDGQKITFTALNVDGEAVETPAAVEGTIADKTIKAAFKLSAMASEAQEVEAHLGVYAQYAGTYTGFYKKQMGPMTLKYQCVLELDAFGGYEYYTVSASEPDVIDFTDAGTYTVAEDGKFSFLSNVEGATAVEGTLANYMMSTKFPISAMVSNAVELTLYAEEVSGQFTATAEINGKTYAAALALIGSEFALAVGESDAEGPAYVLTGTFEIQNAMMCTLVLTATQLTVGETEVTDIPSELATITAPVAESGINAELLFDLDDTALLGFQLVKMG